MCGIRRREAARRNRHRVAVGVEGLPAPAVAAEKHHLARAVDLDAGAAEGPVGQVVRVAHGEGRLLHVGCPEHLLERDGQVVVIPVHGVRVGRFLIVVEVPHAAGRRNAVGVGPVDHPTRDVDLVDSVVDDVAARIGPEPVPGVVEVVLVERPHGRRPEPHVIVHTLGRFLVGLLPDGAALLAVEHADVVDVAEVFRVGVLECLETILGAAILRAHLYHALVLARGLDHLAAFPDAVGGRLLDKDVLPRLAGHDRAQRVPMVGRAHDDAVHLRVIEDRSEVLQTLRRFPSNGLDLLRAIPEQAAVRVGEVAQLDIVSLREFLGQVAAASLDAHHAQDDALIGTARIDREAGGPQRSACDNRPLQKVSPIHRVHVVLPMAPASFDAPACTPKRAPNPRAIEYPPLCGCQTARPASLGGGLNGLGFLPAHEHDLDRVSHDMTGARGRRLGRFDIDGGRVRFLGHDQRLGLGVYKDGCRRPVDMRHELHRVVIRADTRVAVKHRAEAVEHVVVAFDGCTQDDRRVFERLARGDLEAQPQFLGIRRLDRDGCQVDPVARVDHLVAHDVGRLRALVQGALDVHGELDQRHAGR